VVEAEPVCPFEDIRGHWAEAIICDAFADASDIPEWAATAVRAAAAKGIVKGYRNGKMVLIKIAGFK